MKKLFKIIRTVPPTYNVSQSRIGWRSCILFVKNSCTTCAKSTGVLLLWRSQSPLFHKWCFSHGSHLYKIIAHQQPIPSNSRMETDFKTKDRFSSSYAEITMVNALRLIRSEENKRGNKKKIFLGWPGKSTRDINLYLHHMWLSKETN